MSFEEIYKANYNIVYGYLINLSKNENVAEELLSRTFLKAYESFKSYKDNGKPSAWLCAIAKNEYLKYYKKQKRKAQAIDIESIYDDINIEEKIIDRETALNIHKHLHILKEPYKEIFVLRVFAQLSFKDIAEIFGRTESWARVTYYRAKVKLIERIENDE